ncbi:MAG: heavy-metal-associated domain-containing protein [Oscillospiraceae bacterium]
MSKASSYFTISNLNDKHDVKELKRELDTFRGVISVSISNEKSDIAVDYDTTGVDQGRLEKAISKLGYHITDTRFENHIM